MHIFLNGMFWGQPNTGSGQYLHGLLRWLPQVAPQHSYTLLLPAYAQAGPLPAPPIRTLTLRTPFDTKSKNFAKLWFEQLSVPAAAHLLTNHQTPALIHVPYAAPPLRCALPVVTTVHDIIWRLLPEYAGGAHGRAYFALVAAAIRRCAVIITDSQHSRGDIIHALGRSPGQVHAIPLAAHERYTPGDTAAARAEVAARYGIDVPFIYYVGGLDGRKNVATLVQAFAHLWPACQPTRLVIAGKALGTDPRLFPDLGRLIDDLGVREGISRIEVPFADGPLFYRAATIFAFPSRYEGFGLGPLEAMACGTPVVASSASSLPEVTGDAALTAAPDDVAGWADMLGRLLCDEGLRAELRARGLKRATSFSWQQVARATAEVYTKLRA